jgi:hypothetical protein
MCQHKNEYFISNLKHVVVCQYKKCCCLSRNVEKTSALIKGSSTKKCMKTLLVFYYEFKISGNLSAQNKK